MRRILLLLLLWIAPNTAQAKWREASSEHFVIYSEQSPKELEKYATLLERYDKGMRLLLQVPEEKLGSANRLTVYVVSNLSSVRRLFGSGATKAGFGVAGFYEPRATGSIAITPQSTGSSSKYDLDAQTVLFHEYAHHFLMQNFSSVFPAWFFEGFAEFNSTARLDKDGSFGFGMPAMHRAYGLMELRPLPIEVLLSPEGTKLSAEQGESFYGRGWLLTHYLIFEPSRRGQLQVYLEGLNKGETSLAAAKAAFGDVKKLNSDIDTYLKRRTITYLRFTPKDTSIGKVTIRDVGGGEEAIMDVRIRSKRGVTANEAKEVVTAARRAAAPFPNDMEAQLALAEAEIDSGNLAEAEAAAERAIKANPNAIDALIFKGRAKMAVAVANKAPAADWTKIRQVFVAANRLDPDDPEPLILFYQSYFAQGIAPTQNAAVGIKRALELAPQDFDLRFSVARQYLVEGDATQARRTLVPVAYNPHQDDATKAATAIIAQLDAGKSDEALKNWVSTIESERADDD